MYERKVLTDFGVNDLYLLGKYHYEKAGNCLTPHFHQDMMEIVYCHCGTQLYEVDNQIYRIKGGEIFITFPNELHSTNQKPEEKGILYWLQIYIHPDNNKLLWLSKEESVFLINKLLSISQRHFKADTKIYKIFEEMFIANDLYSDVEKQIRIKQLLLQLIIILIDTSSLSTLEQKDDKVSVISSFIQDNLKNQLCINCLANVVHLSESRFKSWFKQQFGMPAMEYIQRQKINKSIEIWNQNPGKSVTDIAYSLNFSSPQYFSTQFKKYIGVSPKIFKPQLCDNSM
ncbi:MAG: helix-turn-helix transcriptional regulator [Bacteroidetes bacterium]|nr:helix-turn-helix transcriptional regulator [Bacteroidota bacterium]